MLTLIVALIIVVIIICECISDCVKHRNTCCCVDCPYRDECMEVSNDR